MNKRYTLLIHSCDKFSDLWEAHVKLLNRNWPYRNCPTYILTDSPNKQTFDKVDILSAGVGKEITERIKYALSRISTEYIIVTLDDYFPIYPIDTDRIERLVNIMDQNAYDYLRLYHLPKGGMSATNNDDVYRLALDGDYRVNLYVGIWRKDFMLRTLGDKVLNAWEFEVTLTENARKSDGNCAVSLGNEFPILDVVRKGRILPKAAKYLKRNNLYHGNRPVMPLTAYYKLGIKEYSSRFLSMLPNSVYQLIKQCCVALGMKSFSAKK